MALRRVPSSMLTRVPLCERSIYASAKASSSSHRRGKGSDTPVLHSDSDDQFSEELDQVKKSPSSSSSNRTDNRRLRFDSEDVPISGISRPLSEILKELNKKVPDSLIKFRHEPNGVSLKYIPWHSVNRIMNLHAPEWSGEIRSITYSSDGKSVSVVYRVTIYGTDAEIYRESSGTASVNDPGYGDPVQKAEGMAFRRACARFGLGLHLYHEDMS